MKVARGNGVVTMTCTAEEYFNFTTRMLREDQRAVERVMNMLDDPGYASLNITEGMKGFTLRTLQVLNHDIIDSREVQRKLVIVNIQAPMGK